MCVCVGKLATKRTILPTQYAEPHCTLANGHQTLPSNGTSSSRDICDGVLAGSCKPETVSTPNKVRSAAGEGQSHSQLARPEGLQRQQSTVVRDDAVSAQSTPSCDVFVLPVDNCASSSLSLTASSSYLTSSLDVDDDVVDDATFRRRRWDTGSASLRAHARLSAVVGQLLELLATDDHVTTDVHRLLRRVVTEPETAASTPTGSVFELLDAVIADSGLNMAINVLMDAVTRIQHGGRFGHVTGLLRAVELLLWLVTSLSEVSDCRCTCDVTRSDDAAEFDVQLTSLSDYVTDYVTLSRRLRYHCAGNTIDRRFRFRSASSESAYDEDNEFGGHLPTLSVRLSGWCLCDHRRTAVLSRLLTGSQSVCELTLAKTNLDSSRSLWLAEALRSNTSLVRLDLRLSSLGSSDKVAALGEGLRRHRRLLTLNLAGTGLTDMGLRRLLSSLSTNRKLAELDVGFNDFATGSGCLALGDALRTHRPPLCRLRMREDGITWSTATVAPFFRAAACSPRLRCLDVSGNALGDDGVNQLSEALLVNRTLRELNVERCQFGLRGCRALARALRSNDALRSLQISRNAIGDDGFAEIVGALRYNRALASLGANQCHVTNVGLSHLLDALRHNVTVTLVKLCYNDIGRHASPGRRRLRLGNFMTSCSSLQVVRDDVIRDVTVTSRHGDVDGERPASTIASSTQQQSSTMTRCVRSFSDVSSGLVDDVTPSFIELYAGLREVLHDNAKLKILLWGNKIDPWILESPVARFKTAKQS